MKSRKEFRRWRLSPILRYYPKLKNVKMGLREIGIDGANWIRLARNRVQWRAFVNTVMNLRVP
jgi:hypothetical protein